MKQIDHSETKFEGGTFSPPEVETLTENADVVTNDGLGPKWMIWKRRRYLVVLMAYLGETTKEVLRTNLSVAVLSMTENHTITDQNGTTSYIQDFYWDIKTRGFLLSVFYYGLIATHIPGGILAVKYGGSKLYGIGVALAATSTLLTPTAAYIQFYLLVTLRIFEGMTEGLLKPSMEAIFSRWIPMKERSMLVALVATGNSSGVMFGIFLSSAISYYIGWQAVFYITGLLGVMWYAAWLYFVKDNPALEKRISPSEVKYIQYSNGNIQRHDTKISSIPFRKIVTSIPLLALISGYTPLLSMYTMFSTQLPAYIKDVWKLNTKNSGYLTSLPFAANVLSMLCFSPIADQLINRKILSTTWVRKLYISGGLSIMGALSFLIQKANSITAVTACLLLINIASGASFIQVTVNMLDLSPKYSCVQIGILYTISAISSMFITLLTGYITQNKTAEEWHIVFSIMAGFCLLGAVIYVLFGSGQLQSWTSGKVEATEDATDDDN